MTIRKGQDWGTIGPVPAGSAIAVDDETLFHWASLEPPDRPGAIRLLGGDLARTLGVGTRPAPLQDGDPAVVVPIDLGIAHHDSGVDRFAAHAVARRSWWRGPIVGVFNAQFLGAWDVAPRGHPNDGRLDVLEVDEAMSIRQRWAARRRLPTASHVPHPHVRTSTATAREWSFERPLDLYFDGVPAGRTRHLRIDVEPDALTVCVPVAGSP